MMTRSVLKIVVCVFLSRAGFAQELQTNSIERFSVKPDQCIALHKGQVCYKTLQFYWHTPETGKYCLFIQKTKDPLLCWWGNEQSNYRYEFASRKSTIFEIRKEDTGMVFNNLKVKVAWVYQSSRKSNSGWRLF